jgi:hypothetical protein
MTLQAPVGVIVVERVRRRAVQQRRALQAGACAEPEQRRLIAVVAAHHLLVQNADRRLTRTRERDAQPVEHAVLGHGEHIRRQARSADAPRCR